MSKLLLSWNSFVQNRKCISLKLTGKLCVITLKIDEKSEEEMTCCFKIDIKNLTDFEQSKVSKIYTLMGCF